MRTGTARDLKSAFDAGKALLGRDIFSAPAVEILLQLHDSAPEGAGITADRLAATLSLGTSVTLRWLSVLEERGLIRSTFDSGSESAAVFSLSPDQQHRLTSVFGGEVG